MLQLLWMELLAARGWFVAETLFIGSRLYRFFDRNLLFGLAVGPVMFLILGIRQIADVWMQSPASTWESSPGWALVIVVLVPLGIGVCGCAWVACLPDAFLRPLRQLPLLFHDLALLAAAAIFAAPQVHDRLQRLSVEEAGVGRRLFGILLTWAGVGLWMARRFPHPLAAHRLMENLYEQEWLAQSAGAAQLVSTAPARKAQLQHATLRWILSAGYTVLWLSFALPTLIARGACAWGLLWLFRGVRLMAVKPGEWLSLFLTRLHVPGWAAGLFLAVNGFWLLTHLREHLTAHDADHYYPLDRLTAILLGWLSGAIGGWLLVRFALTRGRHPRLHPLIRMIDTGAGWSALTFMAGEFLWLQPTFFPSFLTYRFYSVWAVFNLGMAVCLIASAIDVAHVLFQQPVRQAAVILLATVFLLLPPAEIPRQSSKTNAANTNPAPPASDDATPDTDWFTRFEARLQAIPEPGPIVFVAASGGGSRAALFAALALEALDREPPLEAARHAAQRSFSDQIALISSVSGGSLATAQETAQDADKRPRPAGRNGQELFPPLRNYIEADLLEKFLQEADDLSPFYAEHDAADLSVAGADRYPIDELSDHDAYYHAIRQALDRREKPPNQWLFFSSGADAMCTDFMAPLFRGAFTPGIERGTALSAFWKESFQWGASTNFTGFGAQGYANADRPLVVFNTTDARRGTRMVIGFPPLAADFLPGINVHDRPRWQFRSQSMADFDDSFEIGLSDAVRLSANFPWGVDVARLYAPQPPGAAADRDTDRLLIDGGVNDNTGLATLHEIVERLWEISQLESGHAARDKAAAILALLRRRGVVIVEIDSGAKISQARLGAVETPLQAIQNAAFRNAEISREWHIEEIGGILNPLRKPVADYRADAAKWLAAAAHGAPRPGMPRGFSNALASLESVSHSPVFHVKFTCNHASDRDVTTTWSLGARDKARIQATFFFEYRDWRRYALPRLRAWSANRQIAPEFLDLLERDATEDRLQQFDTRFANFKFTPTAPAGEAARWERVQARIRQWQSNR